MAVQLSNNDREQVKEYGLNEATIQQQLQIFESGIPKVELVSAASIGNGIQSFNENEIELFSRKYEDSKLNVVKFIPASGAASRMFKALHQFLEDFNPAEEKLSEFLEREKSDLLNRFFEGYQKFAFYVEVMNSAKKNMEGFDSFSDEDKKYLFVKILLQANGLNFSELPKGLVPFHFYKESASISFKFSIKAP